jgi:hypothetical protein
MDRRCNEIQMGNWAQWVGLQTTTQGPKGGELSMYRPQYRVNNTDALLAIKH